MNSATPPMVVAVPGPPPAPVGHSAREGRPAQQACAVLVVRGSPTGHGALERGTVRGPDCGLVELRPGGPVVDDDEVGDVDDGPSDRPRLGGHDLRGYAGQIEPDGAGLDLGRGAAHAVDL